MWYYIKTELGTDSLFGKLIQHFSSGFHLSCLWNHIKQMARTFGENKVSRSLQKEKQKVFCFGILFCPIVFTCRVMHAYFLDRLCQNISSFTAFLCFVFYFILFIFNIQNHSELTILVKISKITSRSWQSQFTLTAIYRLLGICIEQTYGWIEIFESGHNINLVKFVKQSWHHQVKQLSIIG